MPKPAGRIYFDPLNGHFTLGTFKDLEEEKITPGGRYDLALFTAVMRMKTAEKIISCLKV